MGISAKTLDEKNKIIAGMKESIPIRELCDGLPEEFVTYMKHVRKLEFEETPNYSLLRSLFRQVFIREKFVSDNVFDWTVQKVVLSKENIAPLMENQITEVKHVREERKRAPCKDEMIIHQKPQPLRHLTPINRMEVIVKTPRDYQVPKLKCKIPQRFLL